MSINVHAEQGTISACEINGFVLPEMANRPTVDITLPNRIPLSSSG